MNILVRIALILTGLVGILWVFGSFGAGGDLLVIGIAATGMTLSTVAAHLRRWRPVTDAGSWLFMAGFLILAGPASSSLVQILYAVPLVLVLMASIHVQVVDAPAQGSRLAPWLAWAVGGAMATGAALAYPLAKGGSNPLVLDAVSAAGMSLRLAAAVGFLAVASLVFHMIQRAMGKKRSFGEADA